MRRIIMSVLSVACLFAAAAQSDPSVETIKLGDRHFELRVTLSGVTDPDVGQRAVLPAAVVACGDLLPDLGRYRFESRKRADAVDAQDASLVFTQEVTCGEASATAPPEDDPPPAPAEPPSAAEETLIREKTLAYLTVKDSGDFDTAHAMFNQAMAVLMTEQSWRIPRRAFNTVNGTPTERRVLPITWYDDPPGAPSHGRYAAADYDASYGNKAFYCGCGCAKPTAATGSRGRRKDRYRPRSSPSCLQISS